MVAEFNNPIYSLIAKPEIKTYADLKGKLLGMAAETGSITISIRKLLAMKGLRSGEYQTQFVDGTPERLSCLTAGDCVAVPLGQPQDFVAMRQGYRLLGLSTEAVPQFVYTVTAVRRSWAEANKATVVAYARALAAAFTFIRDPAKRDAVVRTIVETTGFPEANARLTLALFFDPERKVLPQRGEIDMKGWRPGDRLHGVTPAFSKNRCRRPNVSSICSICERRGWNKPSRCATRLLLRFHFAAFHNASISTGQRSFLAATCRARPRRALDRRKLGAQISDWCRTSDALRIGIEVRARLTTANRKIANLGLDRPLLASA